VTVDHVPAIIWLCPKASELEVTMVGTKLDYSF